ncbi:DUF1684 domain-containing protein [Fulvivirga sediminis]|uniref:DUF1684 domain-containing protein n=1 Tax=Fulvivirga sediminis TaxID=2803949 RepID=A0A937K256_9BACT|nr:DUF1684 domain-containing protein [Fulvivirga sediminis]MBL3658015.1 DUF1684 domain-containing protein [Fulvivirga sediminis]
MFRLKIISFLLLISHLSLFAQKNKQEDIIRGIHQFQDELNEEYANKDSSPLEKKDLRHFEGLDFFAIDTSFYIQAKFLRTPNQKPFKMATSTDRSPIYEKYGEAHFMIDTIKVVLEIYQSHDLRKTEEYKDHLFLPFTDKTNGEETYGGGRYISLKIPEGDTIIIDFNKAYNPYCVYNSKYSCPLVPRQNRVSAKVTAGVKAFKNGN